MTDSRGRGDPTRHGCLIAIGGGEDREPGSERAILREVARHVAGGRLVLATVASSQPDGYFEEYRRAFADLEVGELVELYVGDRREASDPAKLALLDDAAAIFFSGGDQLRITTQIGDTPIEAKVREIHERGGLVAGTSAGAAMMSDTMLVRGPSSESHRIGDLHMAPGLGFIRDVVVDQHFAERGRFGRLIGAVAHSPRILGVGIDEDTAVVLEGACFRVIGSGAVYVVDGSKVSHSNLAEVTADQVLSLHDVAVHVLAAGDYFDLAKRRPFRPA